MESIQASQLHSNRIQVGRYVHLEPEQVDCHLLEERQLDQACPQDLVLFVGKGEHLGRCGRGQIHRSRE